MEPTPENGEQIRRDLASHGNAFVMDGERVDPDTVTLYRVQPSGTLTEVHIATENGTPR